MGIPIPGAYASPRIDSGVLCWYAGDTFEIVIKIELEDQDGEAVEIGTGETVTITFYDGQQNVVYEKTFEAVTDNRVTLAMDETVSAKFPKGKYSYDVRFTHGERTTLARGNRARVE